MGDDIREERDDVVEGIEDNPETPDEAAEQRTDDYEGLTRRLDEVLNLVRDGFDRMATMLDALGVTAIESASTPNVDEVVDAIDNELADLVGLDKLDLL